MQPNTIPTAQPVAPITPIEQRTEINEIEELIENEDGEDNNKVVDLTQILGQLDQKQNTITDEGVDKKQKIYIFVLIGLILAIVILFFLFFRKSKKNEAIDNFSPPAEATPEELILPAS